MVREIIQIPVGKCGNLIGYDFLNTLCCDHGLDEHGFCSFNEAKNIQKMDTYFIETSKETYKPRTILVDTKTETLDSIRASPLSNLYKIDNFVGFGHGTSLNNWGVGHYSLGPQACDEVMECIRREIETCESMQGFQFIHSMAGGTGSGFGTLLLSRVRDWYPDRVTSNYMIFPDANDEIDIGPYSVVLGMHQMIENSDHSVVFDNDKLYKISQNVLKQHEPTYSDLNWLIQQAMGGVTAPLRYTGTNNDDLRKISINLVPFPRLHFFAVSHAPFFKMDEGMKLKLDSEEITNRIWSNDHLLVDIDLKSGHTMTSSCIYRRNLVDLELNHRIISQFLRNNGLHKEMSMDIINLFLQYYSYVNDKGVLPDYTEIYKNEQRRLHEFSSWIPCNARTSFIECHPHNTSQTGTMIASTTAITGFFQRLLNVFSALYNPKADKRMYVNQLLRPAGMDEMEIREAEYNLKDLLIEYDDKAMQPYQSDSDIDYGCNWSTGYNYIGPFREKYQNMKYDMDIVK